MTHSHNLMFVNRMSNNAKKSWLYTRCTCLFLIIFITVSPEIHNGNNKQALVLKMTNNQKTENICILEIFCIFNDREAIDKNTLRWDSPVGSHTNTGKTFKFCVYYG